MTDERDKTCPGKPIPSSTVMLLRDGAEGIETLGVVRNERISFAGALAFPGGSLDAGDYLLAAKLIPGDPMAPYRVAAIREVFEETGVLLAQGEERLSDRLLATLRAELLAGELGFDRLLMEFDLRPALEALIYFAHWVTPESYPRRFNAHFFLADMPRHRRAAHDGGELVASFWMKPAQVSAWRREGVHIVMPPTEHSCTLLAGFDSVAQARAALAVRQIREVVG